MGEVKEATIEERIAEAVLNRLCGDVGWGIQTFGQQRSEFEMLHRDTVRDVVLTAVRDMDEFPPCMVVVNPSPEGGADEYVGGLGRSTVAVHLEPRAKPGTVVAKEEELFHLALGFERAMSSLRRVKEYSLKDACDYAEKAWQQNLDVHFHNMAGFDWERFCEWKETHDPQG